MRASRSLLDPSSVAAPMLDGVTAESTPLVMVPEVGIGATNKTMWGITLTMEQWREAETADDILDVVSEYAALWGALALGFISAEDVATAIAVQNKCSVMSQREFAEMLPDPRVFNRCKLDDLRAGKIIPYAQRDQTVYLLLVDPTFPVVKRVRSLFAGTVILQVATAEMMAQALTRLGGARTGDRHDTLVAEVAGRATKSLRAVTFGIVDGKANESEIGKRVDEYLLRALNEGASDVHFEPQPDGLSIKIRSDGRLQEIGRVTPAATELSRSETLMVTKALLRRVFVLAGRQFDLAGNEPIDGAFTWTNPDTKDPIDIRFVGFATTWGRDMVAITLRFLGVSNGDETLLNRGLEASALTRIKQALASKEGVLITTGPTGSGKSTTMHAMLRSVYRPDMNAITIEDPVERKVPGYRQLEVNSQNPDATYPKLLRATLRMDPDILLVGEIRDEESAEVAMQAANTGHQVMTTVHANTNLLALKRLESLNVNPFLLATTVKLILGQRLVRKLCSACAMPSDGDSDRLHVATLLKDNGYSAHATWADFGLDATDLQDGLNVLPAMSRKGDYEHAPNPTDRIIDYRGLRHPRGCNQCQGTGYSGRVAVFQVIPISRALRLSILARESIDKWEAIAFEEGSRTLFANGLLRVLRGATSLGGIIAALGPGYERGTPL